jgi:hypothetical protein
MQNQALLDTFTELVDRYEQHQGYIQRAREQSSRFSAKIVDKVVRDHTGQSSAVANEVGPYLKELRDAIALVDRDRKKVTDDRNAQQTAIEELELRRAIGELEDHDFQAEADGINGKLSEIQRRLDALTEEYQALTEARDRWKTLYREPDGSEGRGREISRDIPPVKGEPREEAIDDDDLGEMSSVGSNEHDDAIEIGASEDEDDSPGVRVDWEDEPDQMGDMAEDMVEGAPIEVSRSKTEPSSNGGKAAAVLLYQEGTPEEQTYPIDGDVLTIGRSRTNHVQVKNDSKVSRVHAKVYKRDGAFYIEDNKSSNGTLVNGELITERRLFGGEELIIGETFFRFQMA